MRRISVILMLEKKHWISLLTLRGSKMKRNILFIALILATAGCLAQNYYEVPYVGKCSKLTRLTTEQESTFIRENSVKRYYDCFFSLDEDKNLFYCNIEAELTDVYKEQIPDENGMYRLEVYRLMYDLKKTSILNLDPADKTRRKCIGQIIYVPVAGKYTMYGKYIYYGDAGYRTLSMSLGVEARNLQFRICKDNLFVFDTRLCYMRLRSGYDEETLHYETDRYTENMIYRTKISDVMEKTRICEVKIDFPLLDKNNPFKYSVQNAYDGDPATSYVEDTENDLFEINIDFMNYEGMEKDKIINEVQLINGYAASNELYLSNNRIYGIQYDWDNESLPIIYECRDKYLNFQKIYNLNSFPGWLWLEIVSTYDGINYSDTSLSELDFRFEKLGWFFGGE